MSHFENPSASDPALRILYLLFAHQVPAIGARLAAFGPGIRGYVIAPSSDKDERPAPDFGRFQLKRLARRRRGPGQAIRRIFDLVREALKLLREGHDHDAIIAIGIYETAIAAWIVNLLHRRRLIIELPVRPAKAVLCRTPDNRLARDLAARWHNWCAGLVLGRADHIKLIYPGQLAGMSPGLASKPISAFPDFVPVSAIAPGLADDYVLLIGTPLYLKGADLAIAAFQSIQGEFPQLRLLIVGSAMGFPLLHSMLKRGDRIELRDYVPANVAIELIRHARVVVIPSRTDAFPRVAVEAMAAGKPIIAAPVDGMAVYLQDGVNCLFCEPEDSESLARRMHEVLAKPTLMNRLGAQARKDALETFGETAFARRYEDMLRLCIGDRNAGWPSSRRF